MATFTHHPRGGEAGPWEFDATRTYSQTKSWCKPTGFWLSVDDDWRRWCEGDEMSWANSEPVAFDLDTDRCLWLKSVEDIDKFHLEYVAGQDAYRIDWTPVIDSYAGIIIAPYQWERRLGGDASDWYYPWDCASACIWDLSTLSLKAAVSA